MSEKNTQTKAIAIMLVFNFTLFIGGMLTVETRVEGTLRYYDIFLEFYKDPSGSPPYTNELACWDLFRIPHYAYRFCDVGIDEHPGSHKWVVDQWELEEMSRLYQENKDKEKVYQRFNYTHSLFIGYQAYQITIIREDRKLNVPLLPDQCIYLKESGGTQTYERYSCDQSPIQFNRLVPAIPGEYMK